MAPKRTLPKILVVEDNPENRDLIAEILRDIATCEFAANAKEAYAALTPLKDAQTRFKVVLLDLELPEISGLQILEKIRNEEKAVGVRLGEGITVIVVTGHAGRFLEAFDKGCDDYLLKPVDAPLLISKITSLLVNQ